MKEGVIGVRLKLKKGRGYTKFGVFTSWLPSEGTVHRRVQKL